MSHVDVLNPVHHKENMDDWIWGINYSHKNLLINSNRKKLKVDENHYYILNR